MMISRESPDWHLHDYYSIIGVAPTASQREINQAFRALARTTHPDANQADPDAAARFALLAEARDVLGDPDTRAAYDRARKAIHPRTRHESSPAAPKRSWSQPGVVRVAGPAESAQRPSGATVRPGPVIWNQADGDERR